mmetsp:Transcript_7425/g.16355  ORF Transcript_7425/g.16355 Transcript_7425/m.16355 type:complete len:820 (+) Transcript_7425:62-2521(+)
MASRVPASPSLSPGRQVYRTVPQSPALGYRGAHSSVSAAPALAARHTKSTSDLSQAPGVPRNASPSPQQVPTSRSVAVAPMGSGGVYAVAQGGSALVPPEAAGFATMNQVNLTRTSDYVGIAHRPYTPKVPGLSDSGSSVVRSTSPTGGSVPPPRQFAATGSSYSVMRGSSAERRAPQWAAPAGSWGKASVLTLEPQPQGIAGVKPWATTTNGTAWMSPRKSTGTASGSQSRSWSQSSQGRRAIALDMSRPNEPVNSFAMFPQSDKERIGAHSPQLHQQTSRRAPSHPHLQGPGTQQNGGLGMVTAQDEVQAANLRNSLLQHIRSVQKEITRLQLERQRAQQGTQERQVSTARHATEAQDSYAGVVTMCSPTASRAVSAERGERIVELHSKRTPVDSTTTSLSAPLLSGQIQMESANNNSVLAKEQAMADAMGRVVAQAPAVAEACPRHSGMSIRTPGGSITVRSLVSSRRERSFVAVHYAATRIQRAWRVNHWRRKFMDFSEREVGWVGTLDWLQRHCLLYGTELADPEDIRFWNQQRQGAPLDREVDPWGSGKLRDHLNKMWYGNVREELIPQQTQAQQYQQSYMSDLDHRSNGQAVSETYLMYEASRGIHEAAAIGAVPLRNSMGDHRVLEMRQAATSSLASSKATSVSPRREAHLARRDAPSRPKGQVLAAPPAALQQSPPQTHRSPRLTALQRSEAPLRPQSPVQQSASLAATAGMAPIMRQRSPVRQVQTGAAGGRFSLPGLPAYQSQGLCSQGGSVTVSAVQSSIAAPLSGAKARPVAGGSLAVGPQGRPIAASPPPSFAARLQVGASASRR